MRRSLRHPSLVQCLRKGCPCQDLLQPCGHEETVDSSLEIFSLQSFILVSALPDDDIAKSAVTVEGDREDRDLGSLRFFVAVHRSVAKDNGFQWLDASEFFSCKDSIETRAQRHLYCDDQPQVF